MYVVIEVVCLYEWLQWQYNVNRVQPGDRLRDANSRGIRYIAEGPINVALVAVAYVIPYCAVGLVSCDPILRSCGKFKDTRAKSLLIHFPC